MDIPIALIEIVFDFKKGYTAATEVTGKDVVDTLMRLRKNGSLLSKDEAGSKCIGFAEWLPLNTQPKSISYPHISHIWISNRNRKEITTAELYELYEKQNDAQI
jgi:hypothetical protein